MTKKTTKTKPALLEIRQKKESCEAGRLMTGTDTEVYLDGKLLPFVSRITFEVGAGAVAKTFIEMYTRTRVVGQIAPKIITEELINKDKSNNND